MGSLDGRIALITGAGRGIGREHALLFAKEGAKVVVNDLGGDMSGGSGDISPAQETVQMIKDLGGEAIVNGDDVSDSAGAQRLIAQTVDTFGGLDVVVNNAGILRDRFLVNMSDDEWDSVVKVHLRGHFCVTKHAANYWRTESKAGRQPNASVINTSSESGLFANPGQTNYAAAKSAIATFSQICSKELNRYGVRCNAIVPRARTRLTQSTPGLGDVVNAPVPEGEFDVWDPANVSPFVAYLGTGECTINGEVYFVWSDEIIRVIPWQLDEVHRISGGKTRLTVDEISAQSAKLTG